MLYDTIMGAVADVDAINQSLARDLEQHVASYGDEPLTPKQRRAIMRRVERELDPRYGSTQRRSPQSMVFRAIVDNMEVEANATYQDFFRAINREMSNVDPDAWNRAHSVLAGTPDDSPDAFARIYAAIYGPSDQSERVLRASRFDPNRRWVADEGYRLSDRVWRVGRDQRRAIDDILRRGIRRGTGPATLARQLREYLDPAYAPIEFRRDGRVLRRARGRPSGSTAARRLARTELTHINSEATRASVAALEIDGAGIRWALSAAHPRIDICDSLARSSSQGFPPGVYTPDELPGVPHPQCLCSKQPYLPSREDVLSQLLERYAI